MIYHLLGDCDVFSAFRGNAIARNVANMMRFDASRIVVCKSADDTWGFGQDRIVLLPRLRISGKLRIKNYLPTWATGWFFRWAFQPLLDRLKTGDIIWCHNQPTFCAALEKVVHTKGGKLIYHAHNSLAPHHMRSKFSSFTADAVICVSEFIRQEAVRYLPSLKNTYAIHNGADERLFYPCPDLVRRKTPVILFVGRLHPTKGVHVLMKAMEILRERNVDALCKVVGSSGVGGSRSTAYVKSLLKRCPSNVQFASYRSGTEIGEEYRAADIFCCPSIWQEPFGNINVEAIGCGVPVVATSVGGIPEIAAQGGVVLVKPKSAVELADALQKLIEDKNLRTRVAGEGLKSFQRRFTWSTIVEQYREVVNTLVKPKAACFVDAPVHRDGGLAIEESVCAVIVSFFPTKEDLLNLASVREQVRFAVVVDNGSNETSLVRLREACQALGIHLIENGVNLGIGAALNTGVRWAQAQNCNWVVLFDQDSAPTVGFVEKLLLASIYHPQSEKIAIMAPSCVDARSNCSGGGVIRLGMGKRAVAQTSGSLIPMTVFEKEGWFDENFFIDCVDWEYCLRVLTHGWIIEQCKGAVLRHTHGQPVRYKLLGFRLFLIRNYNPTRRYYQARNAFWLFRRHGRRQTTLCLYILGGLGKNLLKVFVENNWLEKLCAALRGCIDGICGCIDGNARRHA